MTLSPRTHPIPTLATCCLITLTACSTAPTTPHAESPPPPPPCAYIKRLPALTRDIAATAKGATLDAITCANGTAYPTRIGPPTTTNPDWLQYTPTDGTGDCRELRCRSERSTQHSGK